MTINTIKELRRILPGDTYTAEDIRDTGGGGYYRKVATEAGYFVRLADGVVFLTDEMLREALEKRQAVETVETVEEPALTPLATFSDS